MAPYLPSSNVDDCINATVAVAIDRDKSSQFALRWAVDNLPMKDKTVVLVHVRVKQHYQSNDGSGHGSTTSETSKDQSESDQMQQFFLPFRGFCARKGLLIVLNLDNRNFMRKPDVATVLTKLAPDFCGVYVISKLKATTTRSAIRPVPFHGAPPRQLLSVGLTAPDQDLGDPMKETCKNNTSTIIISPRSPNRKCTGFGLPDLSRFLDCGCCRSRTPFTRGPSRRGGLGPPPLARKPAFDNRSHDHIKIPPKERLRSPFENRANNNFSTDNQDRSIHTLRTAQYYDNQTFSDDDSNHGASSRQFNSPHSEFSNTSDDDHQSICIIFPIPLLAYCTAIGKQPQQPWASELQQWKTEECRRFERARFTEEAALKIAKMEQAKCKEAIEAAAMAQKIAEMEAKKRMEAEMKVQWEAEEKKRALNSLAKNDIRYRKYTIEEIEAATNNFSGLLKIGEGGYGPVYRTIIDHTPVAVKVLKADAVQGMKQFQQEVEVLSCIRHPNMVLLLGACPENGCLVYEYMDNGSLDDRLFRHGDTPAIPWQIRFKVAAEIATALLFLHQTKPEPLVHRDLKPGNILLDRNYTSKISDVGLARLVPPSVADTVTQYRMTSAAGTFCYIDPEYQQTGMLGIKSDVYSLGIMLLQIITAKPPMGLSHYVERSIEKGTFEQMLDPTVPNWPVQEALSFAKIALQCSELRRKDRPDLGTVVLPELNRLRDLGINESFAASLFVYAPWSYTANSRPRSSVTSEGTSKSCIMGVPYRSSQEEHMRAGSRSRSVTESERFINRKMITVDE
ncbi:Protein kinase domain [Macleaya cordata]|uniref:RING-type E3 ubiquitin transferase n=1 Tax=Macleaya cordata TaxID=56857 RepID=A0A200Q1X1_MACCD|nr:Protein kinase domain [Macleaya cordata]